MLQCSSDARDTVSCLVHQVEDLGSIEVLAYMQKVAMASIRRPRHPSHELDFERGEIFERYRLSESPTMLNQIRSSPGIP